jgi:transcriptional regulator with XRE-family HTH domain
MMHGEKEWSPDKWNPRHRLIVALHVAGDKSREICEKLGVSESHVSLILNDPRAIYEIENLAQNIADRTVDTALRIKLYANEALDEIVEELRTSRNEKVRQTAAFGLLDRAGYTSVRTLAEEAPPLLPQDVVQRMEETTRELVEHQGTYKVVEPLELEDVEEVIAVGFEAGAPRGGTDD